MEDSKGQGPPRHSFKMRRYPRTFVLLPYATQSLSSRLSFCSVRFRVTVVPGSGKTVPDRFDAGTHVCVVPADMVMPSDGMHNLRARTQSSHVVRIGVGSKMGSMQGRSNALALAREALYDVLFLQTHWSFIRLTLLLGPRLCMPEKLLMQQLRDCRPL